MLILELSPRWLPPPTRSSTTAIAARLWPFATTWLPTDARPSARFDVTSPQQLIQHRTQFGVLSELSRHCQPRSAQRRGSAVKVTMPVQ
eukprot:355973-Amphidinium_carterae.2